MMIKPAIQRLSTVARRPNTTVVVSELEVGHVGTGWMGYGGSVGAWSHAVPSVMAIFSLSHTASAGATKAGKVIYWGHELGFGS